MAKRKTPLATISVVLATIVVGLVVVLFKASPAPAAPTIMWSPTSVTETILAGESKTVPLSFTSPETLNNVVVRVVPELEQFVQVSPAALGAVAKGETIILNFIVSAPASSLPGTFQGTLQLRNGSVANARTFARPLPIIVNITWPVFRDDKIGVEFTYPPTFMLIERSTTGAILEDPGLDGFTIEVTRRGNMASLPLEDWIATQYFGQTGRSLAEITPGEPVGITGRLGFRIGSQEESGEGVVFFVPDSENQSVYVLVFHRTSQDQSRTFAENGPKISKIIDSLLLAR